MTSPPSSHPSKELSDCVKKHLKKIESDDEWDREIEADAKAGRLDDLWEQVLDDIKDGRTKSLDAIVDTMA